MSEMTPITIPELKDFLKYVAVPHRRAIFIWGPPGVGKSEAVTQLAHEAIGMPAWVVRLMPDSVKRWLTKGMCVDVRLSQYDSVDLRGFPGVRESLEYSSTVWYAPSTLPFKGNPQFPDDRLIFLFLDEMNAANDAVAAVAYQLINDRRVGEHELMDNVIIIAAGNRDQDRGITRRQAPPLANRFTHTEVRSSKSATVDYFINQGLPPEGIAFLGWRGDEVLNTFDPSSLAKAFATPRTWEWALRFYADTTMPATIKRQAIAGTVGEGPTAEFYGFLEVWETIPPYMAKIRKDPTGCPLPPQVTPAGKSALSMTYATAVAVSGELTLANVHQLSKFLMRLEPEFIIVAWQLALKRDDKLFGTDEYLEFAKLFGAVFQKSV